MTFNLFVVFAGNRILWSGVRRRRSGFGRFSHSLKKTKEDIKPSLKNYFSVVKTHYSYMSKKLLSLCLKKNEKEDIFQYHTLSVMHVDVLRMTYRYLEINIACTVMSFVNIVAERHIYSQHCQKLKVLRLGFNVCVKGLSLICLFHTLVLSWNWKANESSSLISVHQLVPRTVDWCLLP